MLHIAICDDQAPLRKQLQEHLTDLSRQLHISVTIRQYPSGKALLFDLPRELDILFLDIEMPELSGMDTAKQLRTIMPELTIVFVTNFIRYAVEGYRVGAYRYLLKPVDPLQLCQELSNELIRLERAKAQTLCIKNDDGLFLIPTRDILYLEADGHRLTVHSIESTVTCHRTLASAEAELTDAFFFRCHKSFSIHLAYIREIRKDHVVMTNQAVVPISKHRKKELLTAFTKYLGGLL